MLSGTVRFNIKPATSATPAKPGRSDIAGPADVLADPQVAAEHAVARVEVAQAVAVVARRDPAHAVTEPEVDRQLLRPLDQELLEILACPLCKEEVKLVPLAEARRASVRDKFREKFRGEEPVVEQGLQCVKCRRIYPIVSDIPVMLVEEAFEE